MILMVLLFGCPHPAAATASGAFRDDSCGERTFPREIQLDVGTYTGRDLVSPCPVGVTCMWSGIVEFHGTWTRDRDAIVLVETGAAPQTGPSARPKRLTPNGAGWKDENGCTFVPTGATLPTAP
jgi:hypothetical protein